jgi:hypothetical protein
VGGEDGVEWSEDGLLKLRRPETIRTNLSERYHHLSERYHHLSERYDNLSERYE